MKYLSGKKKEEAEKYLDTAVEEALKATCSRAKCGSVIVKDEKIIGRGYNSPPGDLRLQKRCSNSKQDYDQKVTDKTCCVHAEQRAIMDALRNHPEELTWSKLYFIRLDQEGNKTKAGRPYCTICSKMALDVGITEFVLWHEKGICVYNTAEYNDLSFDFRK